MKLLLTGLVLLVTQSALAFHITTKNVPLKAKGEHAVTMTMDIGTNALADLLFVIDDSGSMMGHQQNLIKNLNAITTSLNQYANINTAVITTTATPFSGTSKNSGIIVGPVLNTNQKDFINFLATQIQVGTNGDSTEQPLKALSLALSEPNLSGPNAGFLRPNADLIVMFLTDTEDQSALDVNALVSQLNTLKPKNTIKAFAAMVLDPKTCSQDPASTKKTDLADFVKATNGAILDLCSDFAQTIPDALGQLTQIDSEVELQVFPNTIVDTKTINVSLGGQPLVAGDVLNGWVFNASNNVLTLGANVLIKPKSSQLKINYNLVNK